jgi:hypothetical protein
LGDGSLSVPGRVEFTTSDSEIVDSAKLAVERVGCSIRKINNSHNIGFRVVMGESTSYNKVAHIIDELKLFGKHSYEKAIPDCYLWNSSEVRIALLQGLMDTDGTVNKNGMSVIFTSTSKELASQVQILVWSLGGKAVITTKHSTFTYKNVKKNGRIAYNVHISMPKDIIPFRLVRKCNRFVPRTKYQPTRYVDKVELVGKKEAKCILVEDDKHLYITDDFIVTHNTLLTIAAGLQQTLETPKRYKSLVICRPIQPMGKDVGFLPGSLQEKLEPWTAPIKDNLRYLISQDGRKSKNSEESLSMLFENGTIEVDTLTFIRGRSIANAFMISIGICRSPILKFSFDRCV